MKYKKGQQFLAVIDNGHVPKFVSDTCYEIRKIRHTRKNQYQMECVNMDANYRANYSEEDIDKLFVRRTTMCESLYEV